MDAKDLDFWGVTKFHKYENGDPFGTIKVGYIPEHIQSHFIAVRNSMIKSKQFQNYWNKMGEINDYRDAVGKHEAMFTKRFLKWDLSGMYMQIWVRNIIITLFYVPQER